MKTTMKAMTTEQLKREIRALESPLNEYAVAGYPAERIQGWLDALCQELGTREEC